ncbi:putative tail fiber protein [Flavobacterium phage vB_FspP_elemoA_2-5C]|nr:putative tail fiber protein [Flavobacterium phage vB_FspP_elemoA_2-5C]
MATIPSGTKFLGVDPTFTDLTERKGTKVDRKSEYFTLEDITATVGVGSEGPQGVEGPAGPPGPVGPAGLEWQGAWDTDSSYAEDDAVGFNGASWFCISAVTGTGNSNPEEDTTHWALLAAQGAQGIQGIQGPTGPQGPSGTSDYKIYRAILNQTGTSAPVATVLENTIGSIVWSRNSPGTYSATLVGAFQANKTFYSTFGTSNSLNRVYTNRLNDDVMSIISISEDFTTYLDNELFNFPIEIIVYN